MFINIRQVILLLFSDKLMIVFRITLQVTDVLPARIRACEARPGLAKCGGAKPHKGR